ncbi:Uncharacterized protein FWK35_00004432 [Aphis craccivora]|uniref:Uncharacterized protein n=1 Tax=Aphis craccivora TaxID=307492 RepID=A0A6G0YKE0_APHCR|nr:Uncharacterized protein FWK35_00004432 [Aphis craccivora]
MDSPYQQHIELYLQSPLLHQTNIKKCDKMFLIGNSYCSKSPLKFHFTCVDGSMFSNIGDRNKHMQKAHGVDNRNSVHLLKYEKKTLKLSQMYVNTFPTSIII